MSPARIASLSAVKGAHIAASRKLRFHRAEAACRMLGKIRQPSGHIGRRNCLVARKCTEPQQRAIGAAAPREQRRQPRLQRQACFIGDVAGHVVALGRQRADPCPARAQPHRRAARRPVLRARDRAAQSLALIACGHRQAGQKVRPWRRLLAALGPPCKKPLAHRTLRLYQAGNGTIRQRKIAMDRRSA